MATEARYFEINRAYHIYNRGNRRDKMFHHAEDYSRFLVKMHEYAARDGVVVLVYCLMPKSLSSGALSA